jgi:hypothetical protein
VHCGRDTTGAPAEDQRGDSYRAGQHVACAEDAHVDPLDQLKHLTVHHPYSHHVRDHFDDVDRRGEECSEQHRRVPKPITWSQKL